jgi:predicted nucleotidyltransferase
MPAATMATLDARLSDPVISTVRRRVRDHYGDRLAGLYLFGSRARGAATADSDWDFAVVLTTMDSLWTELGPLSDIAHDLLMDSNEAVSLIPVTTEDFHSDRRFPTMLRQEAIRL